MSVSSSFLTAYRALNQEQKAAVDTIDGPVMVVAGPGTGKTQVIALRIANILKSTDTDPDAILALTFTESGARAMRERLVGLIGSPAYYVNISTFHSFCVAVIRDNPDYFTLDPSEDPLSELERLKLVHHLLDISPVKLLRPVGAPYHYARACLSSISDLKREGVNPQELATILIKESAFLKESGKELTKTELARRVRDLKKTQDLLLLYRAYQKELDSSRRFDFEDMINVVTDALRANTSLLRSLQERFHYFLVDEYQDTNTAQNELLLLLASYWGQDANLMVTGDPDQSIMRFQGASIENQLSFIKHYPSATVITLRENYRSTQVVLDAADSLISHNNLRISDVVNGVDSHLHAHHQSPSPAQIGLAALSSHTGELVFLAEDIKNKLGSGTSPSEIAIIYRTNVEAAAIADTLVKFDINYQIQGGANILDDPTVRNFLKLLKVVGEMRKKQDDEDLFTILHYDLFSIESLDVLKLSRLAASKRLTLFDILASPELLDSLELKTRDQLESTLTMLAGFSQLDANRTFSEFFELVLNDSGYLAWILNQPDSYHRVSRLSTLFNAVKSMNRADHHLDLSGFLNNLRVMEENHLRIDENSFGRSSDAVTLTTAHSAKGLEWDHVYLTRTVDRHWGNNRARELLRLPEGILVSTNLSEKEQNEDDRRLFYVALTRARLSCILTYSQTYEQGGTTRTTSPSLFLAELGDSHLHSLNISTIEQESRSHLERLLTVSKTPQLSQDERVFLQELVAKFALSVTALNTYLECPYKFKLDKLLKVPHSKKPHLAFGTAVHSALESFYREFQDTSLTPKLDFLLAAFELALGKEVLTREDHTARLKQGREILSAYYDFFQDDFREPLFLEKFFKVTLEDFTLTGKIDRIEWLDQVDRTVKVTDYKTGKGKSRGQIEGTTKDSSGDLKRQLVFYKLLLDLDRRLKNITFGASELDFVQEPAEHAKSGRHAVAVTAGEVEELKKLIRQVMSDIRGLHFPRTTSLKSCAKCSFRDHCYPQGIPSY